METVTKLESFWEDPAHLTHASSSLGEGMSQSPSHSHNSNLRYERNLNFSTVTVEDGEYGFHKKKSARDPLSHRIIEKRRRDRMNNCLADLARLLPQASLRKGRGRIEKTEIVELAIKHLKHLQNHPCPLGENCEFSPLARTLDSYTTTLSQPVSSPEPVMPREAEGQPERRLSSKSAELEHYRLGYQECLKETMHFLLERKGTVTGDTLYLQLVEHLNRHADVFNVKARTAYSDHHITIPQEEETFSDNESDSLNSKKNNDGSENEEGMYKLPVIGCYRGRRPSDLLDLPGGGLRPASNHSLFDFDGDNNSCSSTPLSLDISDVTCDGKKIPGSCVKPPLPSIVGSHSSSGNSAIFTCSNGRSSDDGSVSVPSHRYKFKSTIKQRFTADLETTPESTAQKSWNSNHNQCHSAHRSISHGTKDIYEETSPSEGLDDEQDCSRAGTPNFDEKPDLDQLNQNCSNLTTKLLAQRKLSSPMLYDCRNQTGKLSASNDKSLLPILPVTAELGMREKKDILDTRFKKVRAGYSHQNEYSRNEDGCGGVPAFALHESGLFYIPLTLERDFVTQFSISLDSTNPNPPLHPITISVCFLLKDARHSQTQEAKFSDLNVQRGLQALNLCKLSCDPSATLAQAESLSISHSTLPPTFVNQLSSNNDPNVPRNSRLSAESDSLPFSNPIQTNLDSGVNREGRDNLKTESPNLVPPAYYLTNRRQSATELYKQNCSNSSSDLPRNCRKRHSANLSPSSASSSSLSLGYHSWREYNQPVIMESVPGDFNDLHSKSGNDSVLDFDSVKGEKLEGLKTLIHNPVVKLQRNGATVIPKRQRKTNATQRNTEANGF